MRNATRLWAIPLIIVLSIVMYPSFGQDYRPGYIVKNDKDSINGFVAYTAGKKSVSICSFKATSGSPAASFSPNQLRSYGIYGDRHFVSLTLPGATNEEKVFARVLALGAIDLYSYNKDFIIGKEELILLTQPQSKKVETDSGTRMVTDKSYVAVVNQLVRDCNLRKRTLPFAEREFTAVVKEYNHCKGEEVILFNPRPLVTFNFNLFAGYVQSRMKMDLYDEVTLNPSKTVAMGIGTDISSPRIYDRLFVSLECWYVDQLYQAYSERNWNGAFERQDLVMDFSYLKIPIGFRYNFLRESATPYVRVGFFSSILIKQDIKTLTDSESAGVVTSSETTGGYDVKNPKGLWASVGYDKKIHNNIRIFGEVRYEHSEAFVGTAIQSFSTMDNLNFMLGFRFKRNEK